MKTFKEYLNEQINDWPKTREEVEQELIKHNIQNYHIKEDLTVDVNGNVDLRWSDLYLDIPHMFKKKHHDDADTAKHLPVRFGKIDGNFTVADWPMLETFEGFPTHVNGNVATNCKKLTSLLGIANIIVEINGSFGAEFQRITEGGLGLLLIKGLKKLFGNPIYGFDIIGKYVEMPDHEDKIFECQEALLDSVAAKKYGAAKMEKLAQL